MTENALKQYLSTIPLSLYVHFPWCVRKCPYCDFNSHALKTEQIPEYAYIEALIADLESDVFVTQGRSLQSIFFGGGTPSLFSGEALSRLLKEIALRIPFAADIEITLEANPGTVDQCHFAAYYAAGVNRLSLGVQSFNNDKLARLGRIHNSHAALEAVQIARAVGFNNFNIDLMYGLPEQTLEHVHDELKILLELMPAHVSYYQLTLEPNTWFYTHPPQLPHEDIIGDMQHLIENTLAGAGYQHYEVSAYAKAAAMSRHNLNYWLFGDYLGIGAGAHGKYTDFTTGNIHRYSKHKHPKQYLQKTAEKFAEAKTLSVAETIFEFMLNALRLYQVISFELFEQRTGLPRHRLFSLLEKVVAQDLITFDENGFSLTPLGYQFSNDVMSYFLPKK